MNTSLPVFELYVNGERIPEQLVADEAEKLSTLPCFVQIADPAARQQQLVSAALSGAVDRILIKQESEKDTSLVPEQEIDAALEHMRASGGCSPTTNTALLRVQAETHARFARTARKLIGTSHQPSRAEVEAFFVEHKAEFALPERVESAHIVKHVNGDRTESDALREINVALKELEEGTDFDDVARRYSDCPQDGGRVGITARGGGLVPEFEAAIFCLRTGQHSDVFRTGFGFHIAKTLCKYPARAVEFSEVESEIERRLTALAEARALRAALDRLRSAARIGPDPDNSAT